MKKILALILAVLMIAGSMMSVAAFDDVAADNKYAKAINELQVKKVIQGVTETTFNPDALVTRWQMALFMARAASGLTDDANWAEGAKLFADCSNYLGAIQYCFSMGIIKGTTATTFAPDANITLRDGIIMAIRALGYEKEDEGLEASAKKYNVTGANYWVPYYQRANELGLLENLNDLAVDKALTRAQTAQLIYNMLFTEVYAKNGNDNNYTLNDVAFGGKKVVEVENSKSAWVLETPNFFFGTADSIDEDEEFIIIAFINDDKDVETTEVSFDDLAKYGVDVENVDEYFGGTLEIINYAEAESKNEDNDYSDFEYLTNFAKAEVVELTQDDFKAHDTNNVRLKIGSKTHYIDEDEKNWVAIYTVDNASEEYDDITFEAIATTAALEDILFDAKAYDVDNDGYYEYVYINPVNIDTYVEASAKGVEKCGVMSGVEDVTYSETLAEDDVFVYTYDAFSNTVTVKSVIELSEGKITAYSQKKTEDADGKDITTGYVTIDGTKYTIEDADVADLFDVIGDLGDIDALATAAELRTASRANMSKTVEFYTFDGRIIAFGKTVADEDEDLAYTIVKDFTDFELYEYVVMTAVIDGADEDIKVNKIYEWDVQDGKWELKHNIEKMGYSKLATALDDIAGIYSYTVNDDGLYTLKIRDLEFKMSDFIDNANELAFSSGKAVDAVDRPHAIRLTSDTKIYMITEDEDGFEVETIKSKTSGRFSIPVDENTMFYADKIGFGNPDHEGCGEDHGHNFDHGTTSVLYISNAGDAFDADDYSIVFVEEDLESIDYNTAAEFGIDDEDEDAYYALFETDGKAIVVSTFAAVDTLYAEGADADKLVAGVYLVDADGVIVASKAVDDITTGNNAFELVNGTIIFFAETIKGEDIDVYNFNDIRVPKLGLKIGTKVTDSDTLGANVKTIKFKDYEIEEGEIVAETVKSNANLVKYLEDNYATGAMIIMVPNDPTDGNTNGVYLEDWIAYPGNTICGIIIDNLLTPVE